MNRKIAVVGGGAAGMMAAVQAARAGVRADLYERNDRVGKKILATGNGKCNFSNKNMSRDAYYGSAVSFYEKIFPLFGVPETIDFFGQHGMLIRERNGYLYPLSEQAATVLDILRFALEKYHIRVYTDCQVTKILRDKKKGGFRLAAGQKDERLYDAVILACGGKAAPKTGSDGNGFSLAQNLGHHVTEIVPALVQLRCLGDFLKSVAGVRTEASLTLLIEGRKRQTVRGELQLTDYGISGIPVFQFSREAARALYHKKRVSVEIDFLPGCDRDEYERFWERRFGQICPGREPAERAGGSTGAKTDNGSGQTLERFLTGISNKKINQLIIRQAGCKASDSAEKLSEEKRRQIAGLYRCFPVTVTGTNGFEQAQVSAGGIPAEELTDSLESRLMPGLYFAGEIVDMDGICGGYNLQWAWTSGTIAGRAAAENVCGMRSAKDEREAERS